MRAFYFCKHGGSSILRHTIYTTIILVNLWFLQSFGARNSSTQENFSVHVHETKKHKYILTKNHIIIIIIVIIHAVFVKYFFS